ncbi:MAG: arsenate reductase [Deltaproteobacteria bacterium]|jgi:arsenate reductase|nr:arsenate reductase [Deltaproteobacteria bacterium]MBW2543797.1 arsenate reductase [Deltaproteobacteria bacterium]
MGRLGLYHNPGCSKSRGALEILHEHGAEFDVIEYLKQPLGRETLTRIAELLPGPPEELIRKDRNFEKLGLDPNGYKTLEAVIELLLEHPELMQRPLLVADDRALICRPSEKVLELL